MDDVLKLVDENPYLEIFKDDSGKEKVSCALTIRSTLDTTTLEKQIA